VFFCVVVACLILFFTWYLFVKDAAGTTRQHGKRTEMQTFAIGVRAEAGQGAVNLEPLKLQLAEMELTLHRDDPSSCRARPRCRS
jgi:Tfp pilus assembly protein PilO